jgi:hypothetical protein
MTSFEISCHFPIKFLASPRLESQGVLMLRKVSRSFCHESPLADDDVAAAAASFTEVEAPKSVALCTPVLELLRAAAETMMIENRGTNISKIK